MIVSQCLVHSAYNAAHSPPEVQPLPGVSKSSEGRLPPDLTSQTPLSGLFSDHWHRVIDVGPAQKVVVEIQSPSPWSCPAGLAAWL